MAFRDRVEAGKELARVLERYRGQAVVVYALPRGGVVPGAEVARALGAPLGLLVPRKIGHPYDPEYAVGAVTETGRPVWSEPELGARDDGWRAHEVELARQEARQRLAKYAGDQAAPEAAGKTVVIVDDGMATGLTMIAAVRDARRRQPVRVVVAVPVAPAEAVDEVAREADETVVLQVPEGFFGGIGAYYRDFEQVEDEEVRVIMGKA